MMRKLMLIFALGLLFFVAYELSTERAIQSVSADGNTPGNTCMDGPDKLCSGSGVGDDFDYAISRDEALGNCRAELNRCVKDYYQKCIDLCMKQQSCGLSITPRGDGCIIPNKGCFLGGPHNSYWVCRARGEVTLNCDCTEVPQPQQH